MSGDECTMSHKAASEALDRTMQDLRHNDRRMCGVTLVWAGDFQQMLPVIPHGTKADKLQACLKDSYIWNNIQQLSLITIVILYSNSHRSAKADQGKISSGSISRIVQNTLVNMCTNFGAFMKSRTIGLLCCSTIQGIKWCEVLKGQK